MPWSHFNGAYPRLDQWLNPATLCPQRPWKTLRVPCLPTYQLWAAGLSRTWVSLASVIWRVPWRSPGSTAEPIRSVSLLERALCCGAREMWATAGLRVVWVKGLRRVRSQLPAQPTVCTGACALWVLKKSTFLYVKSWLACSSLYKPGGLSSTEIGLPLYSTTAGWKSTFFKK